MLKTQRNWRLFDLPGEPVTEIEDPRGAPPNLAPQPMYGRRQLSPRGYCAKVIMLPSQVIVWLMIRSDGLHTV